MKLCVYNHPCESDLIIFRFEKYPLEDYCKRLSCEISIGKNNFDEYINSIINEYKPDNSFQTCGRTFLVFSKTGSIEILKRFFINIPIQIMKNKEMIKSINSGIIQETII